MITDTLQILASLCKGCGICAAICPYDAITMRRGRRGLYTPWIDEVKCSRCMLCVKSCPAAPERVDDIPVEQLSDKDIAGPCLEAYAGYSSDEALRYEAASGGIVTSLLLCAFEHGGIDAVLIVKPSSESPFASCAVVVKERQKISKSVGSRYLPVEFSIALRQVIRDNSVKSVGIVGLPCHIDGIKKASLVIPELREKIAFTIALFCKQTKDLRFTEMILAKMKVEKDEVQEIRFRGNGWPGFIQVKLRDGNTIRYPYEGFSSLWTTLSCSPMCCLLCTSPMGDASDISVGDAWLDEYRKNKMGVSLVLVRSETGKKIVDYALKDRRIWMEPVSLSRILDVQPRFIVRAKKDNFTARFKILSLFDRRLKCFCLKDIRPVTCNDYGQALWVMGVRYLTSTVFFRKLFPYLPSLVLKAMGRGAIGVWRLLVDM